MTQSVMLWFIAALMIQVIFAFHVMIIKWCNYNNCIIFRNTAWLVFKCKHLVLHSSWCDSSVNTMATSFIFRVVNHYTRWYILLPPYCSWNASWHPLLMLRIDSKTLDFCYKMIFYCFTALPVFEGHMIDSWTLQLAFAHFKNWRGGGSQLCKILLMLNILF